MQKFILLSLAVLATVQVLPTTDAFIISIRKGISLGSSASASSSSDGGSATVATPAFNPNALIQTIQSTISSKLNTLRSLVQTKQNVLNSLVGQFSTLLANKPIITKTISFGTKSPGSTASTASTNTGAETTTSVKAARQSSGYTYSG